MQQNCNKKQCGFLFIQTLSDYFVKGRAEKSLGAEEIRSKLESFEKEHGYFPKVIVEETGGLIVVEENEKSIQTVLEVFSDMMKISYLSEQYGGPHVMTEKQISFIDNWEVENYRRSVAKAV